MSAKKGKQKIYDHSPNFTLFKDVVVGKRPNGQHLKNNGLRLKIKIILR